MRAPTRWPQAPGQRVPPLCRGGGRVGSGKGVSATTYSIVTQVSSGKPEVSAQYAQAAVPPLEEGRCSDAWGEVRFIDL